MVKSNPMCVVWEVLNYVYENTGLSYYNEKWNGFLLAEPTNAVRLLSGIGPKNALWIETC